MNDTKDVFIKDEGDFVTLGFQTEKGKIAARELFPANWIYGENVLKVDVSIKDQKAFTKVLEIKELTWEEC
ncbi:MAG: hypothetical protein WC333_02090 [Dehalococcoidia bacterium]